MCVRLEEEGESSPGDSQGCKESLGTAGRALLGPASVAKQVGAGWAPEGTHHWWGLKHKKNSCTSAQETKLSMNL